jgi:hypothetical protein
MSFLGRIHVGSACVSNAGLRTSTEGHRRHSSEQRAESSSASWPRADAKDQLESQRY